MDDLERLRKQEELLATYTVDGNRIVEGLLVSHGTTVKAIAYNSYNEQTSGITILYID